MVPPSAVLDEPTTSGAADPFRRQFEAFAAAAGDRMPVRWDDRKPCLDDATVAHAFDRHYVYHTGWAARVLAETRPARHVDVSSSLYFASIASAFVPVDYYDYRTPALSLPDLAVAAADLTALPWPDRSLPSVSCMHVVEHVGLGRYGDPIDPDGDLKALAELQRVVAPGGSLLIVVPVGRSRVQFNAHRVYAKRHVVDAVPELTLHRFALIPDGRTGLGLVDDAGDELVAQQNYGCGCFWFRRPRADDGGSR